MPVQWNLKQWLAVNRQIYRPSELQTLLEEKTGVQLSLQAISSLLNNVPNALRLSTVQALCNALDCTLSDFCQVLPDQLVAEGPPFGEVVPHHLYSSDIASSARPERAAFEAGGALGKLSVDGAVRAMVLGILKEQGLLPLKQDAAPRPSTISVLLPSWLWSTVPDLTRGLVEGVTQNSYNIALYSNCDESAESDDTSAIDRFLATPFSAGLIAVFPGRLTAQLTRLFQQGFPVVVIDDQETQAVPWVGVDNTTGAYMAVRHLIRLGHQRIAHIQGPSSYLVSHARYQGYCRALLEAGLQPDPELVLEGDFLPPSGRTCGHKLFALPAEKRPTAIFAASDQMAYGVLTAAEECGLSVPADLALVGFDDDHPSAYTRPPLTTVRQPYFEMLQQSVALLFSLLGVPSSFTGDLAAATDEKEEKGTASSRLIHVQLQANLVVRESCGANYHSTIAPSS
jgi:LacI family transcriptional regulator